MSTHIEDGGPEILRMIKALTQEHFAFLVRKPERRYVAYHTQTECGDAITLVFPESRNSVRLFPGHLEHHEISGHIS